VLCATPAAQVPFVSRDTPEHLGPDREGQREVCPAIRPGKVALASFAGTESWSDYGNVVLQMAILDTLLSIEQKLSTLLHPDEDDTPRGMDHRPSRPG
jgi:hypothetical protein